MRKWLPTSVDLFAGCGGCALGAMQAGMDVVAMVEYDTTAALTYAVNLCRHGSMQFHFLTDEDGDRMEKQLHKSAKGQTKFLRAGTGWISSKSRRNYPGTRHVIIGDIRMLSGEEAVQTYEDLLATHPHWLALMAQGELLKRGLLKPRRYEGLGK